jgi:hypothetical protein
MRICACIKSTVLALGVVAAFVAAYETKLARASLVDLGEIFPRLGERIDDFGARLGALESRIERGEASLGSRLSLSASGLEGRLSELSRRMELVRREAQSRDEESREAAVHKDAEVPAKAGGEVGAIPERPENRATSDGTFDRILEEAEKAYSESRFVDAAAKYGAILRWAPDETEPRLKRAISLYRANPADSSSYGLIERELRDLMRAGGYGNCEDALEILALLSIERQDWEKASGYFDRLIELRPEDAGLRGEAQECARYAEEGAREERR